MAIKRAIDTTVNSTLKEKITKIIYQNSTDDSYCLRIKFENIESVIDKICDEVEKNKK